MTDLERARALLADDPDEMDEAWLAGIIGAARREGAEAERAANAEAKDAIVHIAMAQGAEGMRERAAAATAFCCFECSRVIRALPLTPEDPPVALCCQGDVPLSECSLYPDHCTPEEPT